MDSLEKAGVPYSSKVVTCGSSPQALAIVTGAADAEQLAQISGEKPSYPIKVQLHDAYGNVRWLGARSATA